MIIKLERPIDARLTEARYVVRSLQGETLLLLEKSSELRKKFKSWEYGLYFKVEIVEGEIKFLEKVRDPAKL